MSILVSSHSSPMLLQNSQRKMSNPSSENSPVRLNDSLLLSRYAATIHYLEGSSDGNDSYETPALYHHKNDAPIKVDGGGASEEDEEDTESEDDDEDLLSSTAAALNESVVIVEGKTPPLPPPASIDVSATSCFVPLLSSTSHPALPPSIQTYLPQLNLNLYSPCSTPISSIRSTSSKKTISMMKDRGYNNSALKPPPSSCFKDTSKTVQNPTNNILSSLKQQKPLYSSPSSFSIAFTIKMDIRSPPQPSQSTSRFMNALQRFKNSSLSQHGRNHQNTNNNSVAPAEIIHSMKLSPSKSSLADKIKIKFQQLDKKKRSSTMNEFSNNIASRDNSINIKSKKKTTSTGNTGFSMPRSASISSITNWSSRLTTSSNKTATGKQQQHNRLSHSTSMTSFLSSKSMGRHSTSVKPTLSLSSSSSSSSSSSLSEAATSPTTITSSSSSPKLSKNAPLSLTKSISSHRLYKNNSNSNNNDSRSSTSGNSNHSSSSHSRPRQPLRAVNPNDSIRLLRQEQKKKPSIRFNKVVSVKETYSKNDYDRGSDPDAVCTRLTPAMAQHIKEELNAYKLHEMQVHEFSRVHTHFFL